MDEQLETAYRAMAADEIREAAAEEWLESLVSDVANEPQDGSNGAPASSPPPT